jgi:hypothetical protein
MLKIFFLLFLFCLTLSVHSETKVCVPKELLSFDPHQSSGPFENYLSEKIHLPFFASTGMTGVIKSLKKVNHTSWELEVSPGIKFQEFEGWKPKRNLSADDVVYSIQRQLSSFAKTVADKESFIPIKTNGLEKSLESIRAAGSMKVILKFRSEQTREDIENFFKFPVGTIVSKEFAQSGRDLNFFPAYGKFQWKKIAPGNLTLQSGNEIVTVFGISNSGLSYKQMKDLKCNRLYYPPSDLVKSAQQKKIPVAVVPVSSSRIYFRYNKLFTYGDDISPLIQSAFHPTRFPSLSKRTRSNQLFGADPHIPKTPNAKLTLRTAYLYYCPMPELGGEEMASLLQDVRNTARDVLKLDLTMASLPCEKLTALRPHPDTLGVLTSYEYRSKSDLINAFNCSLSVVNIFGMCLTENLKPQNIDKKISENKIIFPLAQIESSLVISY